MIDAGRITSIWRYPVKSMAPERVPFADVGPLGLHADRTWAVRDVEHDTTTSAKKLPGLLWCTARYAHTPPAEAGPGNAPEVIVGLPDGREFSSSDPGVHRALSEHVDHEVELRALPPITDRQQYRTPMATKTDLRTVFGLEDDEPLPDLSMFPVRKLAEITRYATPVGSYVDAYPVHILTSQSLAAMAAVAPDSEFDVRRFRPSLLIDSPDTSEHPEWGWCGGVLHGPHADLQPLIPTIRCVMPSHDQPGLERDREITRAIAAHSRRCLGVYGNVVKPGRIAEGDVLKLEPPARPAAESGAVKVKRALMRAVAAAIPNGGRN
ncbi:MOSC domain-containing protein [Candidatus Mycolicibacterium alkanivorans]|uniref:MOSC N-terminal beta barrel domain-containing protein n=1 Tax=Candidatus Mycolicibacterium alkanivorans TaxID=2954114 RepID=A0ABS9YWZ1_9MYCO|nr:MOSC N-terminal beta barrel domain-containing protein [Candidatus Mycolicibacterium alkanivorans]MCI4675771.1 MOSC N-terminal beta barrel domain-containing protein [Candidatus Mycolicibacterium alkanivorans]